MAADVGDNPLKACRMDVNSSRRENNLLDNLTDDQRQAVSHVEGPLLILAGPGSGKTRVVTHRIAHLVQQGIHYRNILGLTFTNKAADEMRQRLSRLVPGQPPWMGTFHGFCSRLLRRHGQLVGLAENFSILDTTDSRRMLKNAVKEAGITLTHTSIDAISNEISWAKSRLMLPDDYQPRYGQMAGDLTREIYPAYRRLLLESNSVDFDDLLLHVATMLADTEALREELDERFRFILVDEYQDTNMAQYAIVRKLSMVHRNLAVTGDPDQSIYGWRGADVSNILRFEEDYPDVKVVRLERNYRSTKNILRVAGALIENNIHRKPKDLYTENDEGLPVRLVRYMTGYDEADNIAVQIGAAVATGQREYRDFAIFYRVNALSRGLEHSLRRLEIPYQVVRGLEFYQRKEVRDVLAYLQLLDNPRNDVAFQRIINVPPRGIGKKSLEHLQQHARRHGMSMFEATQEVGLIESLTRRASVSITNFMVMMKSIAADPDQHLAELVARLANESGMREFLGGQDESLDEDRLANIDELISAAREFDEMFPEDGLERFLEQSALVADTDRLDPDPDQVTLMTMHAAKGLEYPSVFIIGVEAGLIPHERSRESEMQIEEERRLLFVGITRAEQELQMSYTRRRMTRGVHRTAVASEFLIELPRGEMELVEPPVAANYPEDLGGSLDDFLDAGHDNRFDGIDDPGFGSEQHADASGNEHLSTKLTGGAADDPDQNQQAIPALAPEDYSEGMTVEHARYGTGTVVKLSGTGQKRTALIAFFGGEEKIFRLAFAQLAVIGD
jgi:DNA helicase-2/ATP-dependent DNA helicase PcrA